MAKPCSPVAELVENPLSIPFPEFMEIFTAELEPILLSQSGLISIMTGFILLEGGNERRIAVSLTQWESLAAHSAFLLSPSAEPFFQKVQLLTTGPPTIQHFQLGRFKPEALGSSYAHVAKSDEPGHRALREAFDWHVKAHGQGAAVMGQCVEDEARKAAVLFGNHTVSENVRNLGDSASSYTVSWQRNSVKRRPQIL